MSRSILTAERLAQIDARVAAALPVIRQNGFDPGAVWFQMPDVLAELHRMRGLLAAIVEAGRMNDNERVQYMVAIAQEGLK